jgi:hypothetical protein
MKKATPALEPVLVTEQEAAELTRLPLDTVQFLMRSGQLPTKLIVTPDSTEIRIPYRNLLAYAGSAEWRYEVIKGV